MKTKLNIDGYTCVGCLNRIEQALKKIGVQTIEFDYTEKTAEVVFSENETNPAQIIRTIKFEGYEASIRIFNMET